MIQIFRRNNAFDEKTAKTLVELGLNPRGFTERMFHLRDFRPYALDALVKSQVVKITEDGRLYLSEDSLAASGVEGRLNPR